MTQAIWQKQYDESGIMNKAGAKKYEKEANDDPKEDEDKELPKTVRVQKKLVLSKTSTIRKKDVTLSLQRKKHTSINSS